MKWARSAAIGIGAAIGIAALGFVIFAGAMLLWANSYGDPTVGGAFAMIAIMAFPIVAIVTLVIAAIVGIGAFFWASKL
jgi:hypothetical protein